MLYSAHRMGKEVRFSVQRMWYMLGPQVSCSLNIYYSSQWTTTPTNFLPPSKVTFLISRVCFKSITWYIEMHHVRAFFLCGVMTFSYYVMFIHNMFIFKRKAYRAFCVLICPDHILSSADKQRPCCQFYGRQKPR